jgi:hypothetical protein
MMRTFAAFAWLRWRLMRNQLRSGTRRDTVEQISRVLALLVPALLAALALGSIVGIGVIGFLAGRAAADGQAEPILVTFVTRVLLLIAFALVLAVALAAPVQTAMSRYTRLLLLPIHRQSLHLVEVGATLADPWLLAFIAGIVMMPIGMLVGGSPVAAGIAAVAGVGLVVSLAFFGALTAFLAAWLLRSRRRGEMFTLVFVLGLSLFSYLPMLLSVRSPAERTAGRRSPVSIDVIEQQLPAWTRALPSELYARALAAGLAHDARTATRPLLYLFGECALLALASSSAHRKLLESVENPRAERHRRADARLPRWSLPLIGPSASAIALVQARTALRSVRGRLTVLLPGPMMALLTVVFARTSDDGWASRAATQGHLVLGVSLIFGLYALLAFTMNLFGSDRNGLTLQFLSPIDDATLARGKIVGCTLIFTVAAVLCVCAATLVAPYGSPILWIATLCGAYATLALMSPAAVWLSALFPVAADLSKTGTGGNPHPLPMLVGTVMVLAASTPVALVLAAAHAWPDRAWLALPATACWLAICVLIAWPLVGIASRTVGSRRENLALVATGR